MSTAVGIGARWLLLAAIALFAACEESHIDARRPGYVEVDWIYVAAPQSGWIMQQPVSEGDSVEPGTLMFVLDTRNQDATREEALAQLAQAQAELDNLSSGARPAEIRALQARLKEAEARESQVEAELRRVLPLVERGIETSAREDQLRAEYQMTRAAVSNAREQITVAGLAGRPAELEAARAAVQLADAQRNSLAVLRAERFVHASVSGRVEELFQRTGEYAVAGNPVLAILPQQGLKIRFYVSQAELPKIALGDTVTAYADGAEQGLPAQISFIASDAEFTPPIIYSKGSRDKLVFLVEAEVPVGADVRPGLPLDVELPGS